MPKVIFRPNPTPPPFVPPVPPVPTEPYVTISPFPFGNGASVSCKIYNVDVRDDATYMILEISNGSDFAIEERFDILSPIVGVFTIPAVTTASSSDTMVGHLILYDNESELEDYYLVVYQP